MQKSITLFLLLALLFSGCYKVNKLEVKKPAHLIPKDKMVDIITDMEIIHSVVVYNREHYPEYGSKEKSYYQALFNHYHVTKNQIRDNMEYYISQGNEMAKIYEKVMAKLAKKQAVLDEQLRIKEGKKALKDNPGENFPFLFRENSFGTLCINPVN